MSIIKKNSIIILLLTFVLLSACGLNDTGTDNATKKIIPLKKGNKWVHYQTFTKRLILTEVIGERPYGEYTLYSLNNSLFGHGKLFYKSDSLYALLEDRTEKLILSPNSQRYFPEGVLTDTTISVPVGVYKDPLALGIDNISQIEGNEVVLYIVIGLGPIKSRMLGDYSEYGYMGELELVEYELK